MGKDRSDLGIRMKTYEYVTRTYLTRRTPVIIRLDEKAFHTFTKGMKKPFDNIMVKTMQDTMKYLCEHIEGCVLGYTQSDEITLVLCDYKKLTSEAWFDNNIQKMCSVSASMASVAFNMFYMYNVNKLAEEDISCYKSKSRDTLVELNGYKVGLFDSRVFNIPKEEVNNCLLWRQQDATRNSIESLAQSLYPAKQIEGINTKALQNKMFVEKGVNWNELPVHLKRGSCCIKIPVEIEVPIDKDSTKFVQRNKWVIDMDIPIFSQDTEYVNNRIIFD